MLILTPNEPVLFCVRDGESAIVSASITMLTPKVFEVHDYNGERTVVIEDTLAARIKVHDYDRNYYAYVSYFSDGKIGVDCKRSELLVLRESVFNRCGGKPRWSVS